METIIISGKNVAYVGKGEILINSNIFQELKPEGQTEAFSKINSFSLPTRFAPNEEIVAIAKIPNIIGHLKNRNADFERGLGFVGVEAPPILSSCLADLAANEKAYNVALEAAGAAFIARRDAIQALYDAATVPLIDQLKSMLPPYSYVEGGTNRCKFGAKRISRNTYELVIKTAENVWNEIAPIWADEKNWEGKDHYHYFYLGGNLNRRIRGLHDCRLYKGYMKIGCQEITRYEFEQAQLHYGWALPNTIKEEVAA